MAHSSDLERYSDEERRCGSEQSEASLALLLEEVEGTLAALSNKKRELGQLEERYRAMSDSPVLEEAVHNHQSKAADLEAHRRAAVRGRVVQALYERIKEERERYYQPQVVKNASTWLSRITQGRYTMGVGEDNFIAIDSVNDRPYQLAELSSGTRIQLLFSIRMAFLELLEEGRSQHLPIFFDELMANSDDERSIAISEAIATISGTRQVFYATAQLDEAEKLKSVAKGSVRLFDLESIREERAIERRPFLPVSPKAVEVIDPIADYNGYGEALSVARPALFEPVGGVHSWYLATESGELYALLARGLARIGQSAASDPAYQRRYTLLRHAARLAEQGGHGPYAPSTSATRVCLSAAMSATSGRSRSSSTVASRAGMTSSRRWRSHDQGDARLDEDPLYRVAAGEGVCNRPITPGSGGYPLSPCPRLHGP